MFSYKRAIAATASAAAIAIISVAALPVHLQAAEEPVRIGILTDMSGNYADVGGIGSVLAAQMAVEDFGKTVLGRPIEIIQADHQNKADVGSSIARRWIDLDHVVAIVDMVNSAVALAVQEIGRNSNVVTMPAGAGAAVLTGRRAPRPPSNGASIRIRSRAPSPRVS
jgi:branched-chain amino acid transport system substrate-binding protein